MLEKIIRWVFRQLGVLVARYDAQAYAEKPPCQDCVNKRQHCDYNVPGCPYCGAP